MKKVPVPCGGGDWNGKGAVAPADLVILEPLVLNASSNARTIWTDGSRGDDGGGPHAVLFSERPTCADFRSCERGTGREAEIQRCSCCTRSARF